MSAPGAVNKNWLLEIISKCCLFVKFVFDFLMSLLLIDKTIGVSKKSIFFKSSCDFRKKTFFSKFLIMKSIISTLFNNGTPFLSIQLNFP